MSLKKLTEVFRSKVGMAALAVVVVMVILLAIAADLLRVGPSSVEVGPDALFVSVVAARIPDGNPESDFYYVVVSVDELLHRSEIRPYEADVTVRVLGGIIADVTPAGGDYQETWSLIIEYAPVALLLPAGQLTVGVSTGDARDTATWTVRGERGFRSQPIMTDYAHFLVMVKVAEGDVPDLETGVTLVWYYTNLLQAYPVASRSVTLSGLT